MAYLEIRDVTKRFDSFVALRDVSLDVGEGEFVCFLGPSGCGKTTLLRAIAGLDIQTSGTIRQAGRDISALPPEERDFGIVFQSYALFPNLTLRQNIAFGLENRGQDRRATAARVAELLETIGLTAHGDKYPAQISGGQQQRVALARALAPQPKVLLLDEPLSALDYKLRKEMQIELKRLQHETGITFIFVTHDQEEALTMSDRIAVMSAGKIQQIGSARDIYTRPVNRFVASFIGESNFLPATAAGGKVTLKAGGSVDASGAEGRAGEVTVAVRPEQVRILDRSEPGALPATITNLVYFGTDTHCHMALADGSEVVARLQSPATGDAGLELGGKVGLRFASGAAQVLGD